MRIVVYDDDFGHIGQRIQAPTEQIGGVEAHDNDGNRNHSGIMDVIM